MKTKNGIVFWVSLLAASHLSGCASPPPELPIQMPTLPNDWGYDIPLGETKCRVIADTFANLGIRQNENGFRTQDGLLSRNVLARSISAGEIAETVELFSDPKSNILLADLRAQSSITIEVEISCRSGWHVFTFQRTGGYLGDGVEEKRFQHTAWFRQDRKGKLIARVLQNAEYEIQFSEVTAQSSEEWFFFEPL